MMLAVLTSTSAAVAAPADAPASDKVDFSRDIRPILSENCFACHGPDAKHRKAKLRLDSKANVFTPRDDYSIIVPGKPDESELYLLISSQFEDERMPPAKSRKRLTNEQIALIRKWIEQGAQWREHWSYAPLLRPKPPAVKDADWPVNAIDRFILARLEKAGLKPSPDAGRRTLVRRAFFDLLGLPPTWDQVEAIANNRAPDGYERMVNRLLANPHYGERMAMHWLDLVRFADTVGYHGDQDHNITPYRDYVIKAFNDNKPFDQFTIEQLAGDLLPKPTMWQMIATAYNRVLQTSHEGGVQAREYLAKYLADRVRNVASVWLGATMGCCECHDHKFDPFTQKDFYSLGAFFADVDEMGTFKGTNALPTKRPPEMKAWTLPQYEQIRGIDEEIHLLRKTQKVKESFDVKNAADVAKAKIDKLEAQKAAIEKDFGQVMITKSVEPRTIRVLPRGDWLNNSGAVVEPAVPARLGKLDNKGRATRLDLARWLVSKQNPVTARVFVNRLWALFFGKGIAEPLDDAGSQGQAPVHPELLDWLAVEFMESGWDVKHMVRLIVTSRTYRQSSVPPTNPKSANHNPQPTDPGNRLLARQSRWQLPAEMVRDNALSLSGLLNEQIGGQQARPYQPAGYYAHLNFPTRKYHADTNDLQWRRGVYIHWQRQFLHPMLKAFNAPTREECTVARPTSFTPSAALVLLNDPTFVEAARGFAVRIMKDGGATRDERARWAWQQALGRDPSSQELALVRSLYIADLKDYRADPKAAQQLLTVGLYKAPKDIDPAELAAWTSVARAMFNLNEAMTRN